MRSQWSPTEAREWYAHIEWPRGCNYLPGTCVNRLDFWQNHGHERHLSQMEAEMALAQSIGYNSIRIIMDYFVWSEEHDDYLRHLEEVISCAARHGISVMVVFGNDCLVPKEEFVRPVLGPQPLAWGYHGGGKGTPHKRQQSMGWSLLDEPSSQEQFFAMMQEIIGKYANDGRVLAWNLFNEPGNSGRGEVTVPHLRTMFALARELAPVQPLTADVWTGWQSPLPAEKTALELSDIISFHAYCPYPDVVELVTQLRKTERPLLCTEWLNRPCRNTIAELFPLFFLEKIGSYHWGFVAGPNQAYEPTEIAWQMEAEGTLGDNYDFTKWMHDIFRPSLRPYDPAEIKIIKRFATRR